MDYKANAVIINRVLNMIAIPKIKLCFDRISIYYDNNNYYNNLDNYGETKIQYESEKEAKDNFNKIICALIRPSEYVEYINI